VKRTTTLALGASAALGVLCAVCNIYTADLVTSTPGPAAGQGVGWWSGVGASGCYSAKMPAAAGRPTGHDTAELPPIYLAIRDLRLGSRAPDGGADPNAWQSLGFDLDSTCTSSPTCPMDDPVVSCKPTGAAVPTDGNYCRDNMFGKLEGYAANIPEIGGKYGLSDDAFNCALCRGDYNFLIRISHYNGKESDDQVRVDLYPSPGLEAPLPWSCTDGTWRNHPCFTSDAPWLVRDIGLTAKQGGPALPDAVIADANGYVRQGTLVLQLPPGSVFWFPGKRAAATAFPLTFSQSIVTGQLHKAADGTWSVDDGVIAGRSRKEDLIAAFRLIGFCETDTNYSVMTNFLSTGLDVLADGGNAPGVACDALSVGVGFTAIQAVAGKVAHVEPLVECQPGADAGAEAGADAAKDAAKD